MYEYEVNLSWLERRLGIVSSPALNQSIEVVTPPEFPKGIEGTWSPEHLFVASIESCLMTTFLAIAENSKLEFESFESYAKGKLEKVDGKFLMTEVVLRPTLVIKNQQQQDRAMRILEMSENACLISNSIKSKIVFEPIVIVQEENLVLN